MAASACPTTASASAFHSCTERCCKTTPRALRTDRIQEIFELPSISPAAWTLIIFFHAWELSPTRTRFDNFRTFTRVVDLVVALAHSRREAAYPF
jgi:hypothetical protein